MKKTLLFALLFLIPACAYVDPSLTDQTVVYSDVPVRKSPLQVSVHPRGKQFSPLSAYFYPFIIQQRTTDNVPLADSFARIFHYAWTEERLFSVQEFRSNQRYQGLRHALETARRRGADLLILGKVPYFYAGHTLDDTAITIQVDIYAAGSGTLLWTMMQSARIESKLPDDYILVRHEFRMSDDGFNKAIRSIAKDMAIPLKGWLPDPDAAFGFAETPAQVKQNLISGNGRAANAPRTPFATAPHKTLAPGEKTAPGNETELPPEPGTGQSGDASQSGASTPARPSVRGVNLDIRFDFDKSTIRQTSYAQLDALGEAMRSPELRGRKIIIGGHTDSKGGTKYNMALSKKRADSVKTYLVDKWKADPSTIATIGYGNSRPLNKGTTADEQQMNRRVEIRVAE